MCMLENINNSVKFVPKNTFCKSQGPVVKIITGTMKTSMVQNLFDASWNENVAEQNKKNVHDIYRTQCANLSQARLNYYLGKLSSCERSAKIY